MKCITLFAALMLTAAAVFAQDATTLYNEGVKLKGDNNPSAAIAKFKKALELNPDYTEALYEMGWCQNDTKNYKEAITTLKKVKGVWTTVPKVHFELGFAYEKSGFADSAARSYGYCLFLKPDYANAHKQLGYIAYDKSDYENALLNFANYENAVKNPVSDYLYWYRKGFSYNALKNYEPAKQSLLKSLEIKKDYTNTYLELGFACGKLKQDDAAIAYYNQAIAADPKSHVPYNGIAEVYRDNKKDMQQAMNWYGKTLVINPNERKGNFGMGYCLNSTEKYADAIGYLKKAIESEPTYTAAYVELGYSYYKTNDLTQAQINLNKAIELNSKNENARYYLGLVYISQKNKSKAQQMADELKALNSKNAASLQERVNKMN